jgi:hypothetical protein
MGRSVRQLGSDVITLMELQAELFQVDVRQWIRSFIVPLAALLLGAIVLLATAPVALIALGYVLVEEADWPLWGGMLAAAGVGLAIAAVSAGVGVWLLKRDRPALQRFTAELKTNIRWLKDTLRNSPAGVGE